jgi:hypothetical protein
MDGIKYWQEELKSYTALKKCRKLWMDRVKHKWQQAHPRHACSRSEWFQANHLSDGKRKL